ncbi:M14 family metallocarboxypeptidase [Paenibacillus sp. Marseille-Q4541]|uniref:M14 family metallopeptidase n=1 Tax=Paenibacillus sp. Marseille-Q4541 TaxID=2831522 RepID=UPI001BA6B602|nr:M14 family metallocarboxypeptidase [Paenibacillus sp. Marseille-Q4541]
MKRYGYQELLKDLDEIYSIDPRIKRGVIGKSVLGKDIPYVAIGRGNVHLHVNAGMHANEWLNVPCLMQFVKNYIKALNERAEFYDRDPEKWFEEITLWVLPMLNPDGIELVLNGTLDNDSLSKDLREMNAGNPDFSGWKANIRGVDLNDQFPAFWQEEMNRRERTGPGSRDYGGEYPLSEPESLALANWTTERQFDAVIALHSQGQEIYWNYRNAEPPCSENWATQLALAAGYRSVRLSGSDAGYKDWFIQEFGKPGFTVETGMGVNPLPVSQYDSIALEVEQIMVTAMKLARTIQH